MVQKQARLSPMSHSNLECTEENFFEFAKQHYHNPECEDMDEFMADIDRIKYIKRLINRYHSSGDFQDHLLMNHIIVFYNVFGIDGATRMLACRLSYKYWTVIKPICIFLYYFRNTDFTGIEMDPFVVDLLRKKRKEK